MFARININYLSDQSGVLLRSFRFGDLNLELSTEAEHFLDIERRCSCLSPFSSDLRLDNSGAGKLFTAGSSFLAAVSFVSSRGGVWWVLSALLSALSRRELRRRPRERDREEAEDDDDDERDLRRRDLDRLRERRRLLDTDSSEEGVIRERSVDASFRLVLPDRESWRLRRWRRGERDLERLLQENR